MGQTSHSFMPGFVETVWPLWLIPLFRTAQNGIGSLGFWFAHIVIKRLNVLKALFAGTVLSNLFALIAYTTSSFVSPILLIFSQLIYSVTYTADSTWQQDNFSDTQRSTMGSLISFTGAIIGGLSSLLIGVLADRFGPSSSLMILLLCQVPIGCIYYYMNRTTIILTERQ